jgi:predicted nucleic acid-binding protein
VRGYLLDTSALSAYYNETHPYHEITRSKVDALDKHAPQLVSVISLGEIEFGIRLAEYEGSTYLPEMHVRLERIRQHARLEVSHHTSEAYAELRAAIAKRVLRPGRKKRPRYIEDWVDRASGKTLQIDENDLWICSQAKERDLTLISTDLDFRIFTLVDSSIELILPQLAMP